MFNRIRIFYKEDHVSGFFYIMLDISLNNHENIYFLFTRYLREFIKYSIITFFFRLPATVSLFGEGRGGGEEDSSRHKVYKVGGEKKFLIKVLFVTVS